MANPIFAKTPESYIAALMKVALNAAPGNTYLNQFKTFVTDNGGGTVGLQKLGSALSNYASTDNAAYAASIVSNLGITGASVTEATTNVKALLDTYGADRGKALMQLVDIMINLQSDATWGATANTFVNSVNTGLVYSLNTENTTTDLAVLTAVVNNQTFTLTNATDTATANVFNAGLVYVPGGNDRINALQDEDVLTGTGTKPTLNATLGNANDNGGTVVTPKLSGIETINVGFTGSGATAANQLDLQDSANTGKEINITRISDGIVTATIDNISVASEKLSVSNSGQPGQNVGFLFKNAALNGAADATTLTIKDVQLGNLRVESRTPTAGIGFETINLVSSSDANTVGQFSAEDLETLNISGDANLTLGATGNVVNAGIVEATTLGAGLGNVQGSLKTVNAAELTGNLDITFNGEFNAGRDGTSGQNTALSVTGGKGNDTFRLNADTINTTDVVDGGEGTNTLVMTNGSVVNAAGTATAPVANVKKVQNLEVRAGHDNNVAADATVVNADAFDSLAAIYVRNEGQNGGASAAEVMTVTLNNLTAAQGTAITVAHGTTGNNTILNNVVNANLKTSTGTAETVGITLVDGTNADLRFNLQLSTNADVVTTAAVERVENISVTDNDTESNTVQLVNSAQNTGTITLKGGATGQYLNLDADGSNVNGLSGYGLVETGALGSGAQNAAGTAIATADTAVNAVISTVDYRVLNDGTAADVRLIAENVNAADYVGDVIVRLADVTRTDGISSMSVTGGAGNDTFIFDAQGVKNSGYTSGDTVKAGAGSDTLVIDGNTLPGVGGNVSVQKSEWDNTTGVDVLRLAGNQGVVNGLAANVIAAGIVASNTNVGGYYIEIDNEFVKQTDAGNNLKIVSNDGNLATNLESDLVLNLRPLTQTSNVTFVGANSNVISAGVNASNRLQVEDNSANGVNVLDGGDSQVDEAGTAATRVSSGNNNVLEVFNTADVSINDLSNTKNFGRIEGSNDLAVAQTLKLVLNDTVVDQLVDAGTAARATAVGAVPANVERLVVVANNNANVAGAVENLNIDASAVSNKFALDVIVDRGTTNTIVGTAGADKVVIKGNFTAAEQVADGHAAVALFAGTNALTGAALTTAIAANGTAYKGVDGVAGTADDVLLAYTGTYTNIETIETFGGVDLTGATISAGTTIVAHSAVRLTAEQFNALGSITFVGGGAHGLQIVNNTTTTAEAAPNLSKVTVSGAGTTVNYFTGTEVPAATGTATLSGGATTLPTNGGTTTGTNGGTSTGGSGSTSGTASNTLSNITDTFDNAAATVVATLSGNDHKASYTQNGNASLVTTAANLTDGDTLKFGTGTDTLTISGAVTGFKVDGSGTTAGTHGVDGTITSGLDVLQLDNTTNSVTVTNVKGNSIGDTVRGLTIKGGSLADEIAVADAAATATAGQQLSVQTNVGNDTITLSGDIAGVNVDAGEGNDTIVAVLAKVVSDATTIAGGNGTDTLKLTGALDAFGTAATLAKLTGIEVLDLTALTTADSKTLSLTAIPAATVGLQKIVVAETGTAGGTALTIDSSLLTALEINVAAMVTGDDLIVKQTSSTAALNVTGGLIGKLDASGTAGAVSIALGSDASNAIAISTGTGKTTITGGDSGAATADTVTVTVSATAGVKVDASAATSQLVIAGTAANQAFVGGNQVDILSSGDFSGIVLSGGAGADRIFGDADKTHKVVLNQTATVDALSLFDKAADKVILDTGVFTSLAGVTLATTNVLVGAGKVAGSTATEFLVLNTTDGALYYDADGSGATAAVKIANIYSDGTSGTTDGTTVLSVSAAELVGIVELKTTAEIAALFA